MREAGNNIQDKRCGIQETKYRIQDAGGRKQYTGYKMREAGNNIQDTRCGRQETKCIWFLSPSEATSQSLYVSIGFLQRIRLK